MSVMVDNIEVTKCSLYKDGKCRSLTHLVQGEYINCNSMCDYGAYARKEQLKRLEQENEELKAKCKELSKKFIDADAGKTQYSFYLDKEEKENEKLRKALEEIREYLQQFKKKKSNFYTLNDVVTDIASNIEKRINEVLDER